MKFSAAFLSLLLLTASASAADALPKDLPPYGEERTLPVPEIVERRLENGLTVWFVPRVGLPRVSFVLAVRGGGASDPDSQVGISALLADTLSEGTAKRSALQIAQLSQELGGSVGAASSDDGFTVGASALVENAPAMLALLAEVALFPSFPQTEVALAKTNTLEGLKASEADPDFLAEREFAKLVFGAHPYRRSHADPKTFPAITRDDLLALYSKRFRPDQALLVIAGPIKAEDAHRMAHRSFASWLKPTGAFVEPGPAAKFIAPQRVIIDRPGSVQSSILIGRSGVSASDPDAIPLALANVILGGGFTSRITQNIREDKGYTYSPGSSVQRAKLGGAVQVSADVRNEVTAATLNELNYELERMGTTQVDADELLRAKRYFAGLYLYANQLQGAVAGSLASNWLLGLPPAYLGNYVALAKQVTPEQIRDVARRYYKAREQSIVIVGDAKAISPELEQLGGFVPPRSP